MLKDGYLLWKNYKVYFLVALVLIGGYVLSADVSGGNLFLLFYPALLICMIPVNLISTDENSGWLSYSAAMPLSRAKLVSARYLLALLLTLGTVLLYLLLLGIKFLRTGSGLDSLPGVLGVLLPVLLLPPAIMLPLMLKYGYAKGNSLYLISLGVVFSLISIAIYFLSNLSLDSLTGLVRVLMIAAPLGIAVLFGLSWLLSIRIYKKKEF